MTGPLAVSGVTVLSLYFGLSGVDRLSFFLRSFPVLVTEELGERGCLRVVLVSFIDESFVALGDFCFLKWVETEGGFGVLLRLVRALLVACFTVLLFWWRSLLLEVDRRLGEVVVVMIG